MSTPCRCGFSSSFLIIESVTSLWPLLSVGQSVDDLPKILTYQGREVGESWRAGLEWDESLPGPIKVSIYVHENAVVAAGVTEKCNGPKQA